MYFINKGERLKNKIDDKQRNTLIVSFLKLREALKAKKKLFIDDFDANNKKSKLYGIIDYISTNNLIKEKDKDDLTNKLKDSTKDASELVELIETQVNTSLNNLGYTESNVPKKDGVDNSHLKDNSNIVESYEKIITSIENMIAQLDKQMLELGQWIDKISASIHYDYSKSEDKSKTNEVESSEKNDVENHNLNDFVPMT